jgi:4-hydroxybenzoate polyprenyltransferase
LSLYHILRVPNLLIVAATLWIIADYALYPLLQSYDIGPNLAFKDFYLLIFITMCVTAGGYLINDILDIDTDEINEKRPFIRSDWQRYGAYVMYGIITVVPLPFAYSLASEINHPEYTLLYFAIVLLLFAYNYYLKKMPLVGNLVVAMLCASVIALLILAEKESLTLLKENSPRDYGKFMTMCQYYMGFAFFTNLTREIIKDMQDIKGDEYVGHRTFPVLFGIVASKWLIGILHTIIFAFLSYWALNYLYTNVISLIGAIIIFIPAILIAIQILTAQSSKNFGILSQLYKLWMFTGLVLLYLYIQVIF